MSYKEWHLESLRRDQAKKWWQAKENPTCLFEHAPILFTAIVSVWLLAALIPGVAMLSRTVACAVGAVHPWC